MRLYTQFEMLVNRDMLLNGYNPLDINDIKLYWKERLI
jgi:hypothetical protein